MSPDEVFAGRVYSWAACYGIVLLLASYAQPVPDPWHLPYLGFVGVALVFQGVFLVIARDPRRYLALMPLTLFEKLCFGVPAVAFAVRGQATALDGVFGAVDLFLMMLFLIAWRRLVRSAA